MKERIATGGLRYWMRVLRPFSWWVLFVLALYCIRLHQRLMRETRIEFSVRPHAGSLFFPTVTLDRKPVMSGQNIPLGDHTFVATCQNDEPYRVELFAWYGPHALGDITLKRSIGGIHIRSDPPALRLVISGPELSVTLRNVGDTNVSLPTDNYTLSAEYSHWSESQNVAVFANHTAMSTFSPQFGALHVECNLEGATFTLQSSDGQTVEQGNVPTTVTALPVGGYQLTAIYHGKRIETPATAQVGITNEIPLKFVFGSARIESNPEGASVNTVDGDYLGQTPLDVPCLSPQTAVFKVSLNEYEPVTLALEICVGATNLCRTNLLNSGYVSAIKAARSDLLIWDYDQAAKDAAAALTYKPGDADAMTIQKTADDALGIKRVR